MVHQLPRQRSAKEALLNCVSCHNLDRIVRSQYDGEQFCRHLQPDGGLLPGQHAGASAAAGRQRAALARPGRRSLRMVAEYLAIGQSQPRRHGPTRSKTLPRLSGRSNRVIVTEYDLPRRHHPAARRHRRRRGHRLVLALRRAVPRQDRSQDRQGLGISGARAQAGLSGRHARSRADKDGNLWIGMMYQAGIARFDKKTEKFKTWSMPKEWQTDAAQTGHLDPAFAHVDGKVWVKNSDGSQILRLDLASGKMGEPRLVQGRQRQAARRLRHPRRQQQQSLSARLPVLDTSASSTPRPAKFTIFAARSPTRAPRRGASMAQDRLWYAQYARQRDRHVRSQDREGQGMGRADAVGAALRRRRRQERRGLDRLDDERPRLAARSEDRRVWWSISCRRPPTSAACSSTTRPRR